MIHVPSFLTATIATFSVRRWIGVGYRETLSTRECHSIICLVAPQRAINRDWLRGSQFKGPKSRESSHLSLFKGEGAFRRGRALLAIARTSGKGLVSCRQRARQSRSIRRQRWHKQTSVSCEFICLLCSREPERANKG